MIFFLIAVGILITLFLLNLLLNKEQLTLDATIRKEAAGSFVSLSQGVTHYRIYGDEKHPTLVLIHGISLPSFSWHTFAIPLAAAGFRVLTYDLFGRGYSDRPNTLYNADLYTTQLDDLLSALHCTDKVSILGISMGGGVANHFASRYSHRVKKVVLMTPLYTSNLMATLITTPPLGEWLFTFFATKKLQKIQKSIAQAHNLGDDWGKQYNRQMEFVGYKRAIISSVRNFATDNHAQSFKKIESLKIPTLLMWGKDDPVIPFAGHKTVQKWMPHIEFLPLDECGHLIPLDQTELVTKEVITFLQKK